MDEELFVPMGGIQTSIIAAVVVLRPDPESLPRAVNRRPRRLKTRATKTRNAPMLLVRLLSYVSHSRTGGPPEMTFYQRRYDDNDDDEPDEYDGSLHGASGEEGEEGGMS